MKRQENRAVNGGANFALFILTVDRPGWLCYLIDKTEFNYFFHKGHRNCTKDKCNSKRYRYFEEYHFRCGFGFFNRSNFCAN